MYVRKYKHEPSALLEEARQILGERCDPKLAQRVELVSMVLRGEMSTAQVAAHSGFSIRSIQGWVRIVDEEGWDALTSALHIGRPNRLSPEALDEIRQTLLEDPKAKGYARWTGVTVADYIQKKYGVVYGSSSGQKLMCRLGVRDIINSRAKSVSGDPPKDDSAPQGTPDPGDVPQSTPCFRGMKEKQNHLPLLRSTLWGIPAGHPS